MKDKTWFSMIVNADTKKAVISIYDEIGGWGISARAFRERLAHIGDVTDIELRINSPGGSVIDGFAIYNMLLEHPAKVTARVDGWAVSMASAIAMAADSIEMPANTWMMIHNPWSMMAGDKDEMRKQADILETMESHLVAAYQRHTDLSEDEIKALMAAETWMDGKEAVEKGFATVTLEELDLVASVNNSKKLKAPEAALAWVQSESDDGKDGSGSDGDDGSTDDGATPDEDDKGGDDGTGTTTDDDKKTDDETGGDEDGSNDDSGKAGSEKKTDEEKAKGLNGTLSLNGEVYEIVNGLAVLPENMQTEIKLSDSIMEKIDAAYDEGLAAGTEIGLKKAAGDIQAKLDKAEDELQTLRAADKANKTEIDGYKARLEKLGAGLNAGSDSSGGVTPASWKKAVDEIGYEKARKLYPELWKDFMDAKGKNK